MNYVDDDTMNEFTPGQISRMWAQIGMFRSGLLTPQVAADANEVVAAGRTQRSAGSRLCQLRGLVSSHHRQMVDGRKQSLA